MKIVIAIPAYNPSEKMLQVISEIKSDPLLKTTYLLIINDGSDANLDLFKKIDENENTKLLINDSNQGKGSAIKSAVKIAENVKADYLITVDADGQHLTKDLCKLYSVCKNGKETALVLGTRGFPFKKTPLRSYLGNQITKFVFAAQHKIYLKDTQTGLRAYHRSLFSDLLQIKYNRFEFEIAALMLAAEKKVSMSQVDIETVYYDKNSNSNFNPIWDSIKIYKTLLRI